MPDLQDVDVSRRPALRWRIVRAALVIVGIVLLIPVGLVVGFRLLHDSKNMPLCGKQTFINVSNWYGSHRSKKLPNVDGRSDKSLAKLLWDDAEESKKWNENYRYVPGLCKGDPGDLVMMYMKVPTRWVHHAAGSPSVFAEYKWVLVPLVFAEPGNPNGTRVDREIPYRGESFERVSSDELRTRLLKTLTFLQDNDRPHWETVVAENEAFLKSLESDDSTK